MITSAGDLKLKSKYCSVMPMEEFKQPLTRRRKHIPVAAKSAFPVSILRKSISGRHRPVRVADGQMTARCRFT